jgi:CheY-like chemotaxis protein
MRILIVDDSELWIKQGQTLLEQDGYEVAGFMVTDPTRFTSEQIPPDLAEALSGTDALLIDKDLGQGITSTRLICVVRHSLPKLPIIRWTGGYEDGPPYMWLLRISTVGKPTRRDEADFAGKAFPKALEEQKLILSGPMGIYAALDETAKPDKHKAESRERRLEQIAQIAQLATQDRVDSGNWEYPWTIRGRSGGVTKHELGHCICDGDLSAEDIHPHLTALQAVIGKFEAAGEIDDRFKICAEFIKAGDLSVLELVHRCY